ncbi:MAG: glycogen/starch/alpha-glucan phosphorylase, partial [Stellaceae bacterium]
HRRDGSDPGAVNASDPEVRAPLDLIGGGDFTPRHTDRCRPKRDSLTAGGDRFLVTRDFRSYIDAQDRVEALYRDDAEWGRRAVRNIAGAAGFSSDTAVHNYERLVWQAPLDGEVRRDRLASVAAAE